MHIYSVLREEDPSSPGKCDKIENNDCSPIKKTSKRRIKQLIDSDDEDSADNSAKNGNGANTENINGKDDSICQMGSRAKCDRSDSDDEPTKADTTAEDEQGIFLFM